MMARQPTILDNMRTLMTDKPGMSLWTAYKLSAVEAKLSEAGLALHLIDHAAHNLGIELLASEIGSPLGDEALAIIDAARGQPIRLRGDHGAIGEG